LYYCTLSVISVITAVALLLIDNIPLAAITYKRIEQPNKKQVVKIPPIISMRPKIWVDQLHGPDK
jgi:hypothetical protein